MKKKFLVLVMALILLLSACGEGVKLDENEVTTGNGTDTIIRGEDVYTLEDDSILKNGDKICAVDNIKNDALFALGEYLYVNTDKGAMQVRIENGKIKKFGSGEIVAAMGRWIYYQSEDNKQKTMTLYKIDMKEGRQLMLFADTIVEVKLLDEDTFYFKGESGNEYINELGEDDGYFYSDWLEEATE